jgi:hypothetical protein
MNQAPTRLPGYAVLGAVLTGVIALLMALAAAGQREWVAAGLCLIASAIAFGHLANAIYRQ